MDFVAPSPALLEAVTQALSTTDSTTEDVLASLSKPDLESSASGPSLSNLELLRFQAASVSRSASCGRDIARPTQAAQFTHPKVKLTLTEYDAEAKPLSTITIPLCSLPRQSWPDAVTSRRHQRPSGPPNDHTSLGWDGRIIEDRRCLFAPPVDNRGRAMDGGRCWSRRGLGYEVIRPIVKPQAVEQRGRDPTPVSILKQHQDQGLALRRFPAARNVTFSMPPEHELTNSKSSSAMSRSCSPPALDVGVHRSPSTRMHTQRRTSTLLPPANLLASTTLLHAQGSTFLPQASGFLPAGTVACVEPCASSDGGPAQMRLSLRAQPDSAAAQQDGLLARAVAEAACTPALPEAELCEIALDEADDALDALESGLLPAQQAVAAVASEQVSSITLTTRARSMSMQSNSASEASSSDSELDTESDDASSSADEEFDSDSDLPITRKAVKVKSKGERLTALQRIAGGAAGRRGAIVSFDFNHSFGEGLGRTQNLSGALNACWSSPLVIPLGPTHRAGPFALSLPEDSEDDADESDDDDDAELGVPGAFSFGARRAVRA